MHTEEKVQGGGVTVTHHTVCPLLTPVDFLVINQGCVFWERTQLFASGMLVIVLRNSSCLYFFLDLSHSVSFCPWSSCDRGCFAWLGARTGRPRLAVTSHSLLYSVIAMFRDYSRYSPSLCVEARDSWIGRLFGSRPHPCLPICCWWNKRTYGLFSPCITSPRGPSRLFCIFSPAKGKKKKKKSLWTGFNGAVFFIKICWPLNCVLMKSMHKRSATFFLLEIRAGWGAVLCIPVKSAHSPARCLRLHSVRIDPSALYHIMSYCLLHTFRFLWRLCMRLLSDIHWFPLA